jgi:xanthine dehydrogenase accessory factor
MTDALLEELRAARLARQPCALVTVAATKGSAPRAAGAKMLVYGTGLTSGTIGGGKFEALAVAEAQQCLRTTEPLLKTFTLREDERDSFGAICGGEATILIEPQLLREALFLIGAGHCAQAVARLAIACGWFVSVHDDRADLLAELPPGVKRIDAPAAPEFLRGRTWQADEAIVIMSRNHELDGEALAAAVEITGAGYIGMIGSRRKVRQVFERLQNRGVPAETLARVYAPIGLDIGADSPAEIAISVLAEVLSVLRGRSGGNLRNLSAPAAS